MPKKMNPTQTAPDTADEQTDNAAPRRRSKIEVSIAPPKTGGDAVELSQFDGQMVALYCRDRDEKKTRFGQRKMTSVYIVDLESDEPLAGIMFQSYFQELALRRWYIGIVVQVKSGSNRQWILSTDGLSKAAVNEMVAHLETVRLDDEAREELLG